MYFLWQTYSKFQLIPRLLQRWQCDNYSNFRNHFYWDWQTKWLNQKHARFVTSNFSSKYLECVYFLRNRFCLNEQQETPFMYKKISCKLRFEVRDLTGNFVIKLPSSARTLEMWRATQPVDLIAWWRLAVSSQNVAIYNSSDYIVRETIYTLSFNCIYTTMNNNHLFYEIIPFILSFSDLLLQSGTEHVGIFSPQNENETYAADL